MSASVPTYISVALFGSTVIPVTGVLERFDSSSSASVSMFFTALVDFASKNVIWTSFTALSPVNSNVYFSCFDSNLISSDDVSSV